MDFVSTIARVTKYKNATKALFLIVVFVAKYLQKIKTILSFHSAPPYLFL